MTPVALSLSVLAVSESATDLGIVLASNMVPMLVFMLVGGTLADRFSRRTLLIYSNIMSSLVLAGMSALLIWGQYSLVAMSALSALSGVVSAFASPALRGIVPELVPTDRLQQANALLSTVRNTARIGGPLLAAFLVATIGGGRALAIDAAGSLVAALCFLRIPPIGRAKPSQSALRDLVDGWHAFVSLRWVVLMSITFALINAIYVGPWQVLGPLLVSEEDGALGWGAVLSVRAVGLLLASLIMLRLTLQRPLTTGRVVGTLSALPLLALGLTDSFFLITAAAFLGGIGLTVSNITYDSTLQSKVDINVLSRVAAYDDLLAYIAIPLSQILVGPAINAFGANQVALFCAIAFAILSVLPLTSRSVRAVDGYR